MSSTDIFDVLGKKISESIGFQQHVDLTSKTPGVYFVQIHLNLKTIGQEIVVEK